MEIKTLNINETQKCVYCIPIWLRDQQVSYSTNRIKQRIEAAKEKRSEPIAIACFGPSLATEWEKIKDFKYVMSCSGAHKFLVERGIIPNWDVTVDPREHKTKLIGPPQKETEYLIASTCHKAVLDHLEGFNVKLWHVFDNDKEAFRVLPAGEWAVTGGCSVGLRCLTLARFIGFTDMHVFGMDGSEGPTGKHAAEHPNQPKAHALVEYKGVTYRTTTSMVEAAKQTWHELDQMPDVTCKFYGEGLVQAMAKDYVRKPSEKGTAVIAINKPELISAEYKRLNAQLHQENAAYGVGGERHAPVVLKLAAQLGTKDLLDYGAGKRRLAKALPFHIQEYDPAVPEIAESPKPADLVISTDCLEHVEPDKIFYVLDDLKRCTLKMLYAVVHCGPSSKTLADGRNSHLLQRSPKWWRKKLQRFFHVTDKSMIYKPPLLYVVAMPKTGAR